MNTAFDPAGLTPAAARAAIRRAKSPAPPPASARGTPRATWVVLPKALAWDFLLFCQRNPKACPLLEVADAGQRCFARFAPGSDIAKDIPRYRVYKDGVLAEEPTDVARYFEERRILSASSSGAAFLLRVPCWRRTSGAPDRGGGQRPHVQHEHPL